MRWANIAAISCGVCASVATLSGRSDGEPTSRARFDRSVVAMPMSLGSPTDGALVGGVPLEERAELKLRWPDGPRWAVPELVSLLGRAARRVHRLFPGSILLVGDLSRREGGALNGHVSHESGRDADVAFYYSDPDGRSVRTEKLLQVRPSGTVPAEGKLRFDEARNWAFVESLLTDPGARVQRIFVSEPLKQRLIDYARHHGATNRVVDRAQSLLRQPLTGHPHDDHFHVRIACPRSDSLCVPDATARRATRHERTASLDRAR